MFKPIFNRYLTTNELYTLVNYIIDAIRNSGLDENLKTQLIDRLNKGIPALEAAINRQKKNPMTVALDELDELRDRIFLGLRTSIEALTYHWELDLNKAAQALTEVIRRHGWTMYSKGDSDQSASIHAMCKELGQEPAKADVETANVKGWLTRLTEVQTEFEATIQKREELDVKEKPVVMGMRKVVYKDLTSTLNFLDSQLDFNSNEALEQLAATINEHIVNITSVAKARHTRRNNKEENKPENK